MRDDMQSPQFSKIRNLPLIPSIINTVLFYNLQ